MRSYRLPHVNPPTLTAEGLGGLKRAAHLEARTENPAASLSFPEHWLRPDVQGALLAMQGRVCAYCGCALENSDVRDVDHFRPKGKVLGNKEHGGYWWLAYVLSNYLFACEHCNRRKKRSKFPVRVDASHCTFDTRAELAGEARLLLHPVVDKIDELMDFEFDHSMLCVCSGAGATPVERDQVSETEGLFNLTVRMQEKRQGMVDDVKQALDGGQDDEAKALAFRCRSHSLVARRILETLRPDLVPTQEDDLRALLSDIIRQLVRHNMALFFNPGNKDASDNAEQLRWALAVLWRDPPALASADVEAELGSAELLDEVRPLFEQL